MTKVNRETGEMVETFLQMLKELRQGAALFDLSDALVELVTAVRATGRKGQILLTLTVAPAARGEVNALLLQDEVKIKAPRSERGATILFADDHGVLTRQDPRQPSMLDIIPAAAQVTQLVPRRTGTEDK